MPAGNVIRLVVATWDLNVVSALVHSSSFTPEFSLPVGDCACVNLCISFCVSAPPVPIRGDRIIVKVCWRKLTGTEDPPSHLKESTRDRPVR